MSLVTVFLSVMVLGLALGNAFLSLASPKRLARMTLPKGQERLPIVQKQQGEMVLPANGVQEMPSGSASFEAMAERERVQYLGKRIDRLEQMLLKINKPGFVAQKINSTNLSKRLEDFDGFKQDTRLEIAALKQRLDKVAPAKESKKPKVPDISDQKLRDLVFRVSK